MKKSLCNHVTTWEYLIQRITSDYEKQQIQFLSANGKDALAKETNFRLQFSELEVAIKFQVKTIRRKLAVFAKFKS